jgi:hypothetical protein
LISFGEILKFITIYKTETSDESIKDLFLLFSKLPVETLTDDRRSSRYK